VNLSGEPVISQLADERWQAGKRYRFSLG